jgi:hypothetical protein
MCRRDTAFCHTQCMTKYKVVLDGLHAFGVEVTSPGQFLSIRGFPTETEAHAWISEQEAATVIANEVIALPYIPWFDQSLPFRSARETSSLRRALTGAPLFGRLADMNYSKGEGSPHLRVRWT